MFDAEQDGDKWAQTLLYIRLSPKWFNSIVSASALMTTSVDISDLILPNTSNHLITTEIE